MQSPLGQAWHDAGRVLGENTASAFTFIVSALPWIPVIIAGFFLLRWFWRFTATARQRWRELRERKA